METELSRALDRCLDRMAREGKSIDACGEEYPHLPAELEPLLWAAARLREAPPVQPDPHFRTAARRRLMACLRASASQPRRVGWFPILARVAAALLLVALLGGGTVAAAANSLPDEPLYGLKLVVEEAQLALAAGPESKAELQLQLADRRLGEGLAAAQAGRSAAAERAADEYQRRIGAVGAVLERDAPKDTDALIAKFEAHLKRHQAELERVMAQAPEPAKPALQKAIEVSRRGQEQAIRVKEGQPGRETAPGQQKAPAPKAAPQLPPKAGPAPKATEGPGPRPKATPPAKPTAAPTRVPPPKMAPGREHESRPRPEGTPPGWEKAPDRKGRPPSGNATPAPPPAPARHGEAALGEGPPGGLSRNP